MLRSIGAAAVRMFCLLVALMMADATGTRFVLVDLFRPAPPALEIQDHEPGADDSSAAGDLAQELELSPSDPLPPEDSGDDSDPDPDSPEESALSRFALALGSGSIPMPCLALAGRPRNGVRTLEPPPNRQS